MSLRNSPTADPTRSSTTSASARPRKKASRTSRLAGSPPLLLLLVVVTGDGEMRLLVLALLVLGGGVGGGVEVLCAGSVAVFSGGVSSSGSKRAGAGWQHGRDSLSGGLYLFVRSASLRLLKGWHVIADCKELVLKSWLVLTCCMELMLTLSHCATRQF